jgi:hypothetical protein
MTTFADDQQYAFADFSDEEILEMGLYYWNTDLNHRRLAVPSYEPTDKIYFVSHDDWRSRGRYTSPLDSKALGRLRSMYSYFIISRTLLKEFKEIVTF